MEEAAAQAELGDARPADPPEAAEVAADRQRPGERAARLDLGRPPAAQLEIMIEPRVGRLVGLRPFRHQQPGDAQPVLAEREGLDEAQARFCSTVASISKGRSSRCGAVVRICRSTRAS